MKNEKGVFLEVSSGKPTEADQLAVEITTLLMPIFMEKGWNASTYGHPPATLPDEPERNNAYMLVTGKNKRDNDCARDTVIKTLTDYGLVVEQVFSHFDVCFRVYHRQPSEHSVAHHAGSLTT
jgi:hypothetical protein